MAYLRKTGTRLLSFQDLLSLLPLCLPALPFGVLSLHLNGASLQPTVSKHHIRVQSPKRNLSFCFSFGPNSCSKNVIGSAWAIDPLD